MCTLYSWLLQDFNQVCFSGSQLSPFDALKLVNLQLCQSRSQRALGPAQMSAAHENVRTQRPCLTDLQPCSLQTQQHCSTACCCSLTPCSGAFLRRKKFPAKWLFFAGHCLPLCTQSLGQPLGHGRHLLIKNAVFPGFNTGFLVRSHPPADDTFFGICYCALRLLSYLSFCQSQPAQHRRHRQLTDPP